MAEDIKEKKEVKAGYEIVDVATQTTPMIKNIATGDVLDIHQALNEILNKLSKIEKAVA